MRKLRIAAGWLTGLVLGLGVVGLAGAETIELVTYYPAPGSNSGQDSQVRSIRVGNTYQALPVPNDGVALIADALAIGVPVPANGTITPLGALQVVGVPNQADKVVFMPGTGGTLNVGVGTAAPNEQLELTGNLRLPPTAATTGTATAGVLFAGPDRFLYNYQGNTLLGIQSGNLTMTGMNNVAVGRQALYSNTHGAQNVALGDNALYNNTGGGANTAVGLQALYSEQTGGSNTAVGSQALYNNTASFNTATGSGALSSNTTGSSNTATGSGALYSNTTGFGNTATGFQALYNSLGLNSTAFGYQTLFSETSGGGNAAFGYQTLFSDTTGHGNIALGGSTLFSDTTGNWNTALGNGALFSNTTGDNNVAIGTDAGRNTTGVGNVFLGYQAGYNEIGSNTLYIANSNTATPLIIGDFSAPAVKINGTLKTTGPTIVGGTLFVGGTLTIVSVPTIGGSTPALKWDPVRSLVGKDLTEFFPVTSSRLGEGTIAALGADGRVVAAKAGAQTLGPTPVLPGIVMDGAWQKIGPVPGDMQVAGKTPVALLGRVSVEVEGPVQVGDVLVAGPGGRAVRWEPGQSVLSYVGLVVEVDPQGKRAAVLVGHQGLQKVLDSVQAENKGLRGELNKLQEEVARLKNSR